MCGAIFFQGRVRQPTDGGERTKQAGTSEERRTTDEYHSERPRGEDEATTVVGGRIPIDLDILNFCYINIFALLNVTFKYTFKTTL